jgi:hypothetical protein
MNSLYKNLLNNKWKPIQVLFIFLLFFSNQLGAQVNKKVIYTDVLVVGGSASGVAAGLQSARMGVATLIVEPTTWLGGMITAAGVAAFDGNHLMPAGLFGEFRNQLYQVYGGPKQVETGWVSNTLFEPHVGDSIFKALAFKEKKLQIQFNYSFKEVLLKGVTVIGAKFISNKNNSALLVYAKRTIDATEMGDVMASAKIPYSLGMESYKETGENVHVPATNDIIQDITYVAILKDFGTPQPLIERPAHYDSTEFDASNTDFYFDTTRKKPGVNARKMLDYGKLPNEKYMLNWPIFGNDIYLNVVEQDQATREKLLDQAKQQTLRFVYFIQKDLGFKNYALAIDEFPTKDKLALHPYYRESRRLNGVVRMKVQNISTPFDTELPLYRTGIAVGDYAIDHHHKKNSNAPQHLDFYPVPSFNIPLGSLIPPQHKNIIIAEKSISVSNVVNGTTRLQPCVLQIGQAAGMLAALSVIHHLAPIDVSVRMVQENLLKSGSYIMPYVDLPKSDIHFVAAQKLGATGLIKGKGVPMGWANKTYFNPNDSVSTTSFLEVWLKKFPTDKKVTHKNMTINDALYFASKLTINNLNQQKENIKNKWEAWGFANFDLERPILRIELAAVLNEANVFNKFSVDLKGNF